MKHLEGFLCPVLNHGEFLGSGGRLFVLFSVLLIYNL